MEKLIRLALADDHKIFRDGIRMALKNRDYINIIWEAGNGKEMLQKLELEKPDVLMMDIRMPEVDGKKALQLIRKQYQELKIIILSMYDDKETVNKMMENGANAYLSKTTDANEIYSAILICMNNEFYFNDLVNSAVLLKLQQKKTARNFYPIPVKFNEKELKILRLMSEDKTTDEISHDVFLSPRTIETIRRNMKTKVGVKTIAGLLMYGIKNRLIE